MKKFKQLFALTLLGATLTTAAITFAKPVDIPIYVKGTEVKTDVKPDIRQGTTFVPISFIAQRLGAQVNWNNPEVSVLSHGDLIVINTKNGIALKNGEKINLDNSQKPFLKDGRVMVPLRFLGEQLGYDVKYNVNPSKSIKIISTFKTPAESGESVLFESSKYKFGFKLPKGITKADITTTVSEDKNGVYVDVIDAKYGGVLFHISSVKTNYWLKEGKESLPCISTERVRYTVNGEDRTIANYGVTDVQYDPSNAAAKAHYTKMYEYKEEICRSIYTF